MLTRSLPQRVDHRKLVNDQAILQGTIPLNRFTRLTQSLEGDAGDFHASLEFRKGRKRRTLVIGKAKVEVMLVCQSCLNSLVHVLDIEIRLKLVSSSPELRELQLDEDGLLVESNLVELVDLFEDELIVNLPMVPRHVTGECQDTFNHLDKNINVGINENVDRSFDGSTNSNDADEQKVRPFAALAQLQEKTESKH
jgi:uncharacterized protein